MHVNDATSPDKEKLGFKVERQIQVTYRLRRGCERTIYFAGKDYPVRYFNFDKPEQFKKNGFVTIELKNEPCKLRIRYLFELKKGPCGPF